MHRHAVLHDWANLIVLPIVVAFAIAGLLGTQAEQHILVKVILAYVGLDTVRLPLIRGSSSSSCCSCSCCSCSGC